MGDAAIVVVIAAVEEIKTLVFKTTYLPFFVCVLGKGILQ